MLKQSGLLAVESHLLIFLVQVRRECARRKAQQPTWQCPDMTFAKQLVGGPHYWKRATHEQPRELRLTNCGGLGCIFSRGFLDTLTPAELTAPDCRQCCDRTGMGWWGEPGLGGPDGVELLQAGDRVVRSDDWVLGQDTVGTAHSPHPIQWWLR